MSSRRTELLQRLKQLGVDPKRSLGQNFLVSEIVIERILQAVRSESFSEVVEVGPGFGAVTDGVIALEKPVILIELDRRLAEYWRGRLTQQKENSPSLRVIEADALHLDWNSLGLSQESLLVSNLPYQIASRLVVERSMHSAGIERMVLMFQKEVAQRIVANCRSENYGLLSVVAQSFWDVSTVCEASPRDFYPPPQVASRVLLFRRKPYPWALAGRRTALSEAASRKYIDFLKAGFAQRRKHLISNLHRASVSADKEALKRLQRIFDEHGLLPTSRAEELSPDDWIKLYESCHG